MNKKKHYLKRVREISQRITVSLTSVICKLLERLIKDHMVDFLVVHQLLNSTRIHKSEVMLNKYVMWFLEEITKWIDEGSPVDIIYLLNSSQHGFIKARSCLTNMLCGFWKKSLSG